MKLILDVDYQDLCLSGRGSRAGLRSLFESAKQSGMSAMLFAPMVCGKAIYPSRVAATMNQVQHTHPGSENISKLMAEFDVMKEVAALAAEFDLKLMLYFRLLDDYFPGIEEPYLDAHPQWWWQSRCGDYQLRGWPCYHYPEVRDYKLRLLAEQLQYGFDGVLYDLARSHAFYSSPHRQPDFFGFNAPIAEAMQAATGKDIRAFDHMKHCVLETGPFARIPYIYSADYIGAAEFDRQAWHWEKGRGFDQFLRSARELAGLNRSAFVLGGYMPPHPAALEEIAPASFYLDCNRLAENSVIDGVLNSSNWAKHTLTPDMRSYMLPYYDGVRSAGKQIGAWLNDMFTPGGGEHAGFVSASDVRQYWDKWVVGSTMDFVVVHEAEFILCNPDKAGIWQALSSCAQ